MTDETQTPEQPQDPQDGQPTAATVDPAAELPDLEPTRDAVALDNLELILDVTVTVSVQVGSTHIPIRELLQMNQGSVLELDQPAGMPMDVLVNGTPIAHGEVVMVNDRVGIRLTDVISPRDRIRSIN
ncbi:MAG: flagellar motor switch protein FliN [Pseudomonadota bacterium]